MGYIWFRLALCVKNFSKALFAIATSLFLHVPSVSAGPADAYADPCKWKYRESRMGILRCLTRNGRILGNLGDVYGLLNKDYTDYSVHSGINTTKYQQVNHGNTLIEYYCKSDSNGTCTGESTKTLYQYAGD